MEGFEIVSFEKEICKKYENVFIFFLKCAGSPLSSKPLKEQRGRIFANVSKIIAFIEKDGLSRRQSKNNHVSRIGRLI